MKEFIRLNVYIMFWFGLSTGLAVNVNAIIHQLLVSHIGIWVVSMFFLIGQLLSMLLDKIKKLKLVVIYRFTILINVTLIPLTLILLITKDYKVALTYNSISILFGLVGPAMRIKIRKLINSKYGSRPSLIESYDIASTKIFSTGIILSTMYVMFASPILGDKALIIPVLIVETYLTYLDIKAIKILRTL